MSQTALLAVEDSVAARAGPRRRRLEPGGRANAAAVTVARTRTAELDRNGRPLPDHRDRHCHYYPSCQWLVGLVTC